MQDLYLNVSSCVYWTSRSDAAQEFYISNFSVQNQMSTNDYFTTWPVMSVYVYKDFSFSVIMLQFYVLIFFWNN